MAGRDETGAERIVGTDKARSMRHLRSSRVEDIAVQRASILIVVAQRTVSGKTIKGDRRFYGAAGNMCLL